MTQGEDASGARPDLGRVIAHQAVSEAARAQSHPQADTPVPAGARDDSSLRRSEADLNLEAHRKMRYWAFAVGGTVSIAYFAALLCVLLRLFTGQFLVSVLGANPALSWHLLVFVGVVLAVFAAIPLSLVMALVKMVTDRDDGGEKSTALVVPGGELGKILLQLFKELAKLAPNGGVH